MIDTASQIRNLRLRLGETRQQFAHRVGVAEKTAWLWETKGVSERTWPRCVDALRRLMAE